MISFEITDLIMWLAPIVIGFGYAVVHHMRKDDEQHREILDTVREIRRVLEEKD